MQNFNLSSLFLATDIVTIVLVAVIAVILGIAGGVFLGMFLKEVRGFCLYTLVPVWVRMWSITRSRTG